MEILCMLKLCVAKKKKKCQIQDLKIKEIT